MVADKVCTQSNTVAHRFLFPAKQVPRPTKRAQNAESAWSNNSRIIARLQLPFTEEKPCCGHQCIHTRQIQKIETVIGCLAKCTSSCSLDRQIQTPKPCFLWWPKIISLLSVELAVMIVFIDSDVPLGEEMLGVNGSWQQHRAAWWCPITRPHTTVINWPPLQQSTSASLTVMHTWIKYNTVPRFYLAEWGRHQTAEDGGWRCFEIKDNQPKRKRRGHVVSAS